MIKNEINLNKYIDYMDESFLITKSWDIIHKRIESKY